MGGDPPTNKIEEERKKEEEEKKKKEEEEKKKNEKKFIERIKEKRRIEENIKKEEKLRIIGEERRIGGEERINKKKYSHKRKRINEKNKICKREYIKKEPRQMQQKEEKKIYKSNEINQNKINLESSNNNENNKNGDKKNQDKSDNESLRDINRKYTLNLKPKRNYEDNNIPQRYANNYLTNRDNNMPIEPGKSVNLEVKNIIKNIMEDERKKEKDNIYSMKSTDIYSDYDNKNNLRFSIMPGYNISNNKNIMMNNDEEKIIFDNENKKNNDICMTPQIKRKQSFIKNNMNKNTINEEKNKGIIKKNEIVKEVENKINEMKIADRNEIKKNENNEIKNQNDNNKNEENKININIDNNMNDNYNDNLNINQILLNNEDKNESLNDNNNSQNNRNNLNKNDNQFAFDEFLRINFNLNTNDLCNFVSQIQNENLENNDNIENIEDNENQEDLSNSPNYFSVLQNINIFNSVLIILNNISFIMDYFSSNIDYIIQKCQFNNTYCLTFITYYMNKYLWKSDDYLNISEYYLLEKYQEFISRYTQFNNMNNSNPLNYVYDPRNTRNIYKSIYQMINNELTKAKGSKLNINNNFSGYILAQYLNSIKKEYNSILSDNLMGFYQYQKFCEYCIDRARKSRFNYNYNCECNYKIFNEITFNLSEINYYYNAKNSTQIIKNNTGFYNNNFNNLNNEKQNIYLDQCFNYTFNERNKKTIMEYCNSCYLNANKSQYNLIFSPPNILTIILTSNEYNENCNFIIQDEINIKKYILNSSKDRIYYLISCLCRLSNTGKYICYCINPKDSNWYSYSDEKINKVEEIDECAVPLILFYQSISTMSFEYKKIMIINKLNEICLNVKFNNGLQPKNISFNKESTIKKVIENILSTINLIGAKGKLSINGERALEDEKLSTYLEENNNVLLMISK